MARDRTTSDNDWEFISLMEENMPRKNKEAAVGYSKLLVHAWVKGSGSQKECIEDFVKKLSDDVAQLQRKGIEMCQLGYIILRIFEMFHTDEAPLQLRTSISKRFIPNLFQYLKSHINRQRCNASELFFRMYPLYGYSTRDKESDFMTKQHTQIEDLLKDKCHIVRVIAVMGTCSIIAENRLADPNADVDKWLKIIVEELSQDSKSYLVRCYVSKGFKKLLLSKLSSSQLEKLMEKMNHLFDDVNAQVRETYCELLMKASERGINPKASGKRLHEGIRWWKIVKLKALLMQIELEDCGTRKWQASLLFHSSILNCKSGTDLIKRIVSLCEMNPVATNKLFILMGKKLSFKQVVEIISAIIMKINRYVDRNYSQMYSVLTEEQKVGPTLLKRKKRRRFDKENVMDDDCSAISEESRSNDQRGRSLDRPAVMQSLLNIASILWRTFIKTFEENPSALHDLHRICHACLPKWFSFFKGTVVFDCLLLLMTHVPADVVTKMSGLQMSLMSQLKQLPPDVPDATAKSLLVPLVLWGNGQDILNLIQDWFNEAFRHCNLNWTFTSQGRKKKVSVIDVVPAKPLLAVRFLSIIYQHPICWDKLLAKCYPQLKEFWSFLETVKKLVVKRVDAGQPLENEMLSDDFIRESLRLYLKLIPFLGNTNRDEQAFDTFRSYSEAIQFAVENLVPHVTENIAEAQRPEHVLVVNLLNDVLDIGCHPLLLVQPPLMFIRDIHLLASKLLKTGCGSLFVVFSLYLLGNLAVHVKGQVGKLDQEQLVFLYCKCVLQLSYLVVAQIPRMPAPDLLLCFQVKEVFKTAITNVLCSSKLFIDNKSQVIMRLHLAYVDSVVELLSHEKDQLVSLRFGKMKDLPVAVAKMISVVLALNEHAHSFCIALIYRFKHPYEDHYMLLAALKLLCTMSGDVRWAIRMFQQCLFVAEEAISARASALGEDFQSDASKIMAEIQLRLKQSQSDGSSQLEDPGSVPSQQASQEEELQLDDVQSQPESSQAVQAGGSQVVPSRMLCSQLQSPRSQLQDPCLDVASEVGLQFLSSSMQANKSQSGESYLESSFEATTELESLLAEELEELPLVPMESCSSEVGSVVEPSIPRILHPMILQAEEQLNVARLSGSSHLIE